MLMPKLIQDHHSEDFTFRTAGHKKPWGGLTLVRFIDKEPFRGVLGLLTSVVSINPGGTIM